MAEYEEKFKGQAERLSGHPDSDHKEKTIGMDTEDMNMKIHDPKSEALDGTKSMMGKAVEHLNRETQRGEHAPMVGGYKHDHTMR